MPGRDGTGPLGQGPIGGQGRGRGIGPGRGRMAGSRPGAGPVGFCVCPKCGEKKTHQRGIPCYSEECPKCKTKMVRP
ncbi:MAG: hypothetical protein ABIB11_06485 [Candidatus Omnitrophota bacterium]